MPINIRYRHKPWDRVKPAKHQGLALYLATGSIGMFYEQKSEKLHLTRIIQIIARHLLFLRYFVHAKLTNRRLT